MHNEFLAEARLLRQAAAANLDGRVPTCPDWNGAQLLHHCTQVYDGVTNGMKANAAPDWPPPERIGKDTATGFDAAVADLSATLNVGQPGDRTWTWHGPDQTVGFWIRRMALETVVHRIDAELIDGGSPKVNNEDLALEGIDEFVTVMLAWYSVDGNEEVRDILEALQGLRIGLKAPQRSWTLAIAPDGIDVENDVSDDTDAIVSADPSDLMLWLWKRVSTESVDVVGDMAAVDRFWTSLDPFTA